MDNTVLKMLVEIIKKKSCDQNNFLVDIMTMISSRCETALVCNGEYKLLQEQLTKAYNDNDLYLYSEISSKMELIACCTCYVKGLHDIYSL